MSLVNLSLDEEGRVWLTRCSRHHDPLVVCLKDFDKVGALS